MVITKDSESFDPGSSPGRTFLLHFFSNAGSSPRVEGCSVCAFPVLVAQLDKASDYESEDWGFKSLQGYLLLFFFFGATNECRDFHNKPGRASHSPL